MVGRLLSAANKEHTIQHVGVARASFTAEKDVWYDHRCPRISIGFAVETLGGNSFVQYLVLVCAGAASTMQYGVCSVLTGIALITDPLLCLSAVSLSVGTKFV